MLNEKETENRLIQVYTEDGKPWYWYWEREMLMMGALFAKQQADRLWETSPLRGEKKDIKNSIHVKYSYE